MTAAAGRVVMVTGATDGLGRATAMALAGRGATVLVHGRDRARTHAVVANIETAGGRARGYLADFARLSEVAALADAILSEEPRLDVLVNNAGLGVEDARRESADGYERLFQVDYLAPYLLTRRLVPLLERSAPARVVNVASAGQTAIDFVDVMLERQWDGVRSYCQAKLADVAMAFDLAPELERRGIAINALHPASMMPTKIVQGRFGVMSTLGQGVDNVVRLAIDAELEGLTGQYFNGAHPGRADPQAYDAEARARLRAVSDDLLARAEVV